jgi:diguanylate cyclase (GGDEF)-like protein
MMDAGPSPDAIVREAAARICASLDVDETVRAIADAARRALGADRATCYVYEVAAQVVSAVHSTEADPRRRAFLERAVGRGADDLPIWRAQLAREDPILAVEDVADSALIEPLVAARLGAGALLGVRLEHGSVTLAGRPTLLGTLFCSYRAPRLFSGEDRSIASGLANLASLALANARLHAQTLRDLAGAETDELTGLPNRGALGRRMEAAATGAARAGRALSAVVLDLDHFRRLNDRHGHGAGDDCLRAVARTLEASLRPGDLAGRMGGAGFLVILPETSAKGAWLVAERLRARIGALPMPRGAGISASLGVASLPAHADSAGELVRAAEHAMYQAKEGGRDRSVVFSPEEARMQAEGSLRAQVGREAYLASVLALAGALDARDPSTHAHSRTVAAYAAATAARLGLDGDRVEEVRIAGLLHDVGKVGIADAILQKAGPLTAPEWAEMHRHPEIGAKLLVHPSLAEVREWVLRHHERPDGYGYPGALTGRQIPLEAMIIGVADAYEAMTADRPYRRALRREGARAELEAGRGAQFDERVLEAFLGCLDEGHAPLPGRAPVSRRASR